MNSTYCCLMVALDHIPSNHFLLEVARDEITIAVKCAREYELTWHSIIWIRSNTRTKRRIREQLNHLAFDCYTHLLEVVDYLNQYADLMNEQSYRPAKWWDEVSCSLYLAYISINRENKREISARQLRLFEINSP
ncbi:hypothetical protein [Nostoc sp. MG11]|uniref:hypothetical protein n=1 Tax=Nostoc sp. MG11 TaxID=2721166 RepID=UPI001868082E|nr:hypothetical protein [Nostoc sp. MG11]